jgi:hypothetical protein
VIVVIQCAGSKPRGAGRLQTPDGRSIVFVANPAEAQQENPNESCVYARPDDLAPYEPNSPARSRLTWREKLQLYNEQYEETGDNPCRLYKACDLYKNSIYSELVEGFGIGHVYILSAGWGLIPASLLTPYYDITFSTSGDRYTRRKPSDHYNDFALLPRETEDGIFFFGGKDYRPLFGDLTKDVRGQRTVYYQASPGSQSAKIIQEIKRLGCRPVRYETKTKTNWHYGCARQFCDTYGKRL